MSSNTPTNDERSRQVREGRQRLSLPNPSNRHLGRGRSHQGGRGRAPQPKSPKGHEALLEGLRGKRIRLATPSGWVIEGRLTDFDKYTVTLDQTEAARDESGERDAHSGQVCFFKHAIESFWEVA